LSNRQLEDGKGEELFVCREKKKDVRCGSTCVLTPMLWRSSVRDPFGETRRRLQAVDVVI